MITKRNALALAVAVMATVGLPKIPMAQEYKKISIGQLYEINNGWYSNGQILWDSDQKIEIKGITHIIPRMRMDPSLELHDVKSYKNRRRINGVFKQSTSYGSGAYSVQLDLSGLEKKKAKDIVESMFKCDKRITENDIEQIIIGNFSIIKGTIQGNIPYQVSHDGKLITVKSTFSIKVEQFEVCLTKEEYDNR